MTIGSSLGTLAAHAVEPPNSVNQAATAPLSSDAIARQIVQSVVAIARSPAGSDKGVRFGRAEGSQAADSQTGPRSARYVPLDYACGLAVSAEGHILTAYHALGDPARSEYWVWAPGGAEPRLAAIVAADPWFDLAVLQVDGMELAPVTFAVGDLVPQPDDRLFVVANPRAIASGGGLGMRDGRVMNVRRRAAEPAANSLHEPAPASIHEFGTLFGLTTESVAPESWCAGGAVLNQSGQLVGVTMSYAIESASGVAGCAAPVDAGMRRVIEELTAGRAPAFGLLGIQQAATGKSTAATDRRGALVSRVLPGTPARAAGLREGDLIVAVADRPVTDYTNLVREISSRLAGSTVSLRIHRPRAGQPAAEELVLAVELAKKPAAPGRQGIATQAVPPWRGLIVDYTTVSPSFTNEGLPDDVPAVYVAQVLPDSPAARAGIRAGGFILQIADQATPTPRAFQQAAAPATGPVTVEFRSDLNEPSQLLVVEP